MGKETILTFERRQFLKWKIWIISTVALVLMILIVSSTFWVPCDPYEQHLELAKSAPSVAHWFGTDPYGRDLFSRVWVGGKATVFSALLLLVLISLTGTTIGLCAGWYGGWIGQVLMRGADLFVSFPGLVLALALAGVSHGGLLGAILALWVVGWPKYARLSKNLTQSLVGEPYVEVAQLMKVPSWKILRSHILPNMAGPVLVTAVLDIGTLMMELSALSFLGVGVKPPVPEWGAMISEGRMFLQLCPWMVMAPGGAMFIVVVVCNIWGDTLRDYYDPKGK